jgi:hypothetical protein
VPRVGRRPEYVSNAKTKGKGRRCCSGPLMVRSGVEEESDIVRE